MEKSKKLKIFIGLFYLILLFSFLIIFFSKYSFEEVTNYKFIQQNRNYFFNLLLILFLFTALPNFFFVTKLIFKFLLFLLFSFLKKRVKYLLERFFPLSKFLKSSFLERLTILLFIKLGC